ncbi:MAG TPA: response regulator [Thermoanaerobaculia bacterium]|jgi:signal transduction histidine kinase/DNA-binding response OmpR family regulator
MNPGRYKFAIGVGFAVLVVLLIVFVSAISNRDSLEASRMVAHTHEVISTLQQTLAWVEAAESSQRAYVITARAEYAAASRTLGPRIEANLRTLRELVSDNPEQVQRAALLSAAVTEKLRIIDDVIERRQNHGFEAARLLVGQGTAAMQQVEALVAAMEAHERRLLERRARLTAARMRNTRMSLGVGTAADILLLAVILWLVLRDERRNRELAGALADGRDAAIRSAEMRSRFLANMSHEIRTPMNAVIGMSNLLLETKLNDDQRDLAQTVRTSADALLTIINDVLDFSKIEAGKLAIEKSDFDLRATVESVIDLLGEAAHAKGLELGALFDHEIPKVLHGDAGRIRQVLTNLAGNAIKFTSRGDVIIHVTKEETKGDTVHVRFEVTDTGIGLPSETIEQLFQPFMQADATTTRRFGGTGLGLAISKHLAEEMGGTIGVSSVEDKGSTFWFKLPLGVAKVDEITRPLTILTLSGIRVLVVDDNETNRRLVRHNLGAWRMESDEAPSGPAALEMLRKAVEEGRPYGLVITDMKMPEMSGSVLARLIKSDRELASTRVIVLTSLTNRIEAATMKMVGIDACLTKPVKQSALYDSIVNATSGSTDPAPQPASPAARIPMRPNARVLLVEDNAVNQKLGVRQVQRLGCHADTAANGVEAVEAVSRIDYDVVLMDCHMPEMDGFDATREIRRREAGRRHTPIIALTANALEGDRERCFEAGMDDYLSKPLLEADLMRALARFIGEESPLDAEVLKNLREVAGGEEGFLGELAQLFLQDSPSRIAALRDAVARHDAHALATAAHGFKSSSGNIGATRMQQLNAELEQLGRTGTTDGAAALVEQLMAEYARVEKALQEL